MSISAAKMDSPYFTLRIVPRHAARIRRVEFSELDDSHPFTANLQRSLGLLALFPNLRELRMSGYTALTIFGDIELFDTTIEDWEGADQEEAYDVARDAFLPIALALDLLELAGFPEPSDIRAFLLSMPSLRSLAIEGDVAGHR